MLIVAIGYIRVGYQSDIQEIKNHIDELGLSIEKENDDELLINVDKCLLDTIKGVHITESEYNELLEKCDSVLFYVD